MADDALNFNDFNDEFANLTVVDEPLRPQRPPQRVQAETRIVGGGHGLIERVPWTCRVRLFLSHICGGAILSPNHVLTAAHCAVMPGIGIYSIIAGSSTGSGAPNMVGRIILHPEYHPRTLQHDIAVLFLTRRLTVNGRSVAAVRLPPVGVAPRTNSVGLISGWYIKGDTIKVP